MTSASSPDHKAPDPKPVRARDLWVAGACGVFVAAMVGMAYAAVPLYDWFCRTTGFGGTTQVATSAPAEIGDRMVTVRFDANVGGGLPWSFEAEQTSMKVRLGEVVTVHYRVRNLSARETTGLPTYNVTPPTVGAYFNKINCFCFSEQKLAPGESRELAVVFYVDPALAKDEETALVKSITLSYTAYPVREERPLAQSRTTEPSGRI